MYHTILCSMKIAFTKNIFKHFDIRHETGHLQTMALEPWHWN